MSGTRSRNRPRPHGRLLWLLLPVALVASAVPATAITRSSAPGAEVAEAVTRSVQNGRSGTFWVLLKGHADLSGAAAQPTKAARGGFVHQALTTYAGRSQAGLVARLRERGAAYQPFWINNSIRVTGDADLLAELAQRPEVAEIEPDGTLPLAAAPATPAPVTATAAEGPDWNIRMIHADKVWNELGVHGEGIVVGSIDSGVEGDHPALAASYRGRLANGRTDDNYNFFDPQKVCPSTSPCDENSHGTETTGPIVGRAPDGTHQIGVAPGARWIAASACHGVCPDDGVLAAGQWMLAPTDVHGRNPRPDLAPDIINNSWVKYEDNDVFAGMLDAWVAAGILPVFAAGNAGTLNGGCANLTGPPRYPQVLTVANVDENGHAASTSSRGPTSEGRIKPDLAAPGSKIPSATTYGRYDLTDGTSLAAPHVSGAVALLWSAVPGLRRDLDTTRALLARTAVDLDETGCGGTAERNNTTGEGLIDVWAAVQAARKAPVGGLAGQVRDARTGRPVADATLALGGPKPTSVRADRDGRWRLDRLVPGTYPYRLEGLAHRPGSGTLVVTAGAPKVVPLSLAPLPPAVVSGVVRSGGKPAAGVQVGADQTSVVAVTGPDGRYRLPLSAGTWDLSAAAPHQCSLPWHRPLTLTGDRRLDIDLADRTDVVVGGMHAPAGYTCTPTGEGYREGTRKLGLSGRFGDSEQIDLPFPVELFGARYTTAWVSAQGAISFDGPAEPVLDPLDHLPSTENPYPALLPFFTGLDVDDQAGVYVTGSAGELVVEWRNVLVRQPFDAGVGGRLSFSATVRPDGRIGFAYRGLDAGPWTAGAAALIGLQDAHGDGAFAYGNQQQVISEGLGLTFLPPSAAAPGPRR